MKTLLLIPAVLLLLAGAYWAAMLGLGMQLHRRELIAAVVICIVSGEIALLPCVVLRKADPATVSQAGLAGTVIHMLMALLLAAILWMQKLITDRGPFLFMLLAFFWISLIVLVLAMARLVRGAVPPPTRSDLK